MGDCLLALVAYIMDRTDNEVVLEVPTVPVKGRPLKQGLLEVGSLLQQQNSSGTRRSDPCPNVQQPRLR